jgi:hypothetical protein
MLTSWRYVGNKVNSSAIAVTDNTTDPTDAGMLTPRGLRSCCLKLASQFGRCSAVLRSDRNNPGSSATTRAALKLAVDCAF